MSCYFSYGNIVYLADVSTARLILGHVEKCETAITFFRCPTVTWVCWYHFRINRSFCFFFVYREMWKLWHPVQSMETNSHDDVIKWKHFLRYWPFVRGIHRSGEFPAQGPVTRSFDVFFDLSLKKWLSKQSRGWWFETQSRPLWRHCNAQYNDR